MLKSFIKKAMPLIILLGLFTLTACNNGTGAVAEIAGASAPLTELPQIWLVPPRPEPATMAEDFIATTMLQLSPLTPGELLVTMHTNKGDVTFRFFPTEAPMAVENFLTHAWNGYYNGITFHRVIDGFMMQGGCPEGTGMGGQSIWGGQFGQELSADLMHFRGALAMAQSSMPDSIGSQFYVVQNPNLGQFRSEFVSLLERQGELLQEFPDGSYVNIGDAFPEEALNYFIENGGTPSLDRFFTHNPHTVFGHVVAGMEVVDAIVAVPVEGGGPENPFQHRPVDDVTITGFTFRNYEGGS